MRIENKSPEQIAKLINWDVLFPRDFDWYAYLLKQNNGIDNIWIWDKHIIAEIVSLLKIDKIKPFLNALNKSFEKWFDEYLYREHRDDFTDPEFVTIEIAELKKRYIEGLGLSDYLIKRSVERLNNIECDTEEMMCYLQELLDTPEAPDTTNQPQQLTLPPELDAPEARKYIARATKVGFMEQTATGYKWLFGGNKGKVRLGYFCLKAFERPRPMGDIERLFNVREISSAITQADIPAVRADVRKWRAEMDEKIFYD